MSPFRCSFRARSLPYLWRKGCFPETLTTFPARTQRSGGRTFRTTAAYDIRISTSTSMSSIVQIMIGSNTISKSNQAEIQGEYEFAFPDRDGSPAVKTEI